MSSTISILLVDDHALLRETLADRLQSEIDMSVVGTACNARDAVLDAERVKPDLVVMDIDMPGKISFDAAREIQVLSPQTRILYLSGFFHDRYIQDALAAGAAGYITKDEPPDVLLRAIRMVASGHTYFSPNVQSRIVVSKSGVQLLDTPRARASLLTKREIEALRYVARGLQRQEIANEMHISIKTLDNHISRIKVKLGIHDRVELARYAIREGLAGV